MRRVLLLLLAGLLVLATAACGNASGSDSGKESAKAGGDTISGLDVTGKFGTDPTVKVTRPVKVDAPVTQVLSAGHGQPVLANKKAMLGITLVRGKDGKVLFSSAQQGTPTQVTMQENQFFKVLIDGLVGKPQGSRVAIAATVKDIWGAAGTQQLPLKPTETVVWVVDVLSVEPTHVLNGPQGKKVTPPAGAPTVEQSNGKVTGLDFSKAPKNPPTKLQVIPLVQGDGPVVKSGQLVTFNYYGAVWGRKQPFDSSYAAGTPATFGVGVHGLIPAWDKVIPGLRQGSRVLIIAPSNDAYGAQGQPPKIPANATLAFVVDVLGVGA